jgi:hypothetical protein
MSDRCRTCDAPILWCRTEAGHAMPLDAVPPLLGGNVELVEQGQGDPIAKVYGSATSRIGFYVSHFSNCPQAAQHRRLRPDGKRR